MAIRVFFNARCGGPDRFGLWELRTDELQSKPLPQVWSCWQPSTGGIRYGKMDFVPFPLDYLGDVSRAHPTGDFHHVSMAFDSVGWPVFATNIGLTGVRLDQHTSESLTEEYRWEGTNAVVFNNYLIEPDVENTDVIAYYTKTGEDRNLYARFSRENYTGEYSLMEFPIKVEELLRAEVESGYYQVLYGKTDHNREIKIYFSEYPEFPYFGNATETNSGTYGFYTGEHRLIFLEVTGSNVTGDTHIDSGFSSYSLISGKYESTIITGSGWMAESGFLESGYSTYGFDTGQYAQVISSVSGEFSGIPDSGYNSYGFNSGQYFEVIGYSSGTDQSSGYNTYSFYTGQYFEV